MPSTVDPERERQYRATRKLRWRVANELEQYRERYGLCPPAERLYARRLADLDAAVAELARLPGE